MAGPGRPRKSAITVSSRAEAAKNAAVEVAKRNPALAKRLAGNPHGGGSRAIPLKEPTRWHLYIENTYVNESAFLEMRENGWVPLTAEDLSCKVEDSGFRLSTDGYLVRGELGREMAWKMEESDYRLLQNAKTDANNRGIGSAAKVKQDAANAAASTLGDEAADYISGLDGQTTDTIIG